MIEIYIGVNRDNARETDITTTTTTTDETEAVVDMMNQVLMIDTNQLLARNDAAGL